MNKPAFPQHGWGGLTKHEYAAIHLAAGILADPAVRLETTEQFEAVATQAVRLASCIFSELADE
jgi:hypothetical protein